MATTTATRKNGPNAPVPPRSFPTGSTRNRKVGQLGPAPFASFEDLSDDNDSSPPDPESYKLKPMPEIKEDGNRTPESETGNLQFGGVTVIPSTTATITSSPMTSVPTSGPTSGLQTPSTPQINISCASSSTPPSEESNSERELFPGGLGSAFQEEGADDLRSSTEELDFGEDDIHDERRKEPDDLRRASHPANLFQRKASMTPTDDNLHRKPSAHSLYLEGFLSRPCRHSSFGSADRPGRPGAISSLSADGRRSASPHKMLLETSFCGGKPIPTPSMDLDSPPKEINLDEPRLYPSSITHTHTDNVNTGMLSSDSSFESHKPFSLTTLNTTVQVHHDGGSGTTEQPPIKQTPQLVSPDSPKSSDHWFPIVSKQQPQSSQPQPQPPHPSGDSSDFSSCSQPQTPAMKRKDVTKTSPISLTMNKNHTNKLCEAPTSPSLQNDRQSLGKMDASSKNRNSSNTTNATSLPSTSSATLQQEPQNSSLESSSTVGRKSSSGSPRSPRSPISKTNMTTSFVGSGPTTCTPPPSSIHLSRGGGGKSVAQKEFSSKSTKEKMHSQQIQKQKQNVVEDIIDGKVGVGSGKKVKDSKPDLPTLKNFDMNDEITTELKITELPSVPVEDVPNPMETKGFFQDDSLEDEEDLPYVPTTLPLEKSAVVPIIPIKERRKLGTMVTGTTTGTPRPRCNRPPNPASLNDYIAYSNVTATKNNNCKTSTKPDEIAKMKINLPRDDSLPESSTSATRQPKSPKKKLSTTWTDFAEMGLRSPREIRRRMREENGANDDITYHSDSSQDTAGPVNGGSDEETESLLKLPKVPFAMDFDVHSIASQEGVAPISPTSMSSAQQDTQDDNDDE